MHTHKKRIINSNLYYYLFSFTEASLNLAVKNENESNQRCQQKHQRRHRRSSKAKMGLSVFAWDHALRHRWYTERNGIPLGLSYLPTLCGLSALWNHHEFGRDWDLRRELWYFYWVKKIIRGVDLRRVFLLLLLWFAWLLILHSTVHSLRVSNAINYFLFQFEILFFY